MLKTVDVIFCWFNTCALVWLIGIVVRAVCVYVCYTLSAHASSRVTFRANGASNCHNAECKRKMNEKSVARIYDKVRASRCHYQSTGWDYTNSDGCTMIYYRCWPNEDSMITLCRNATSFESLALISHLSQEQITLPTWCISLPNDQTQLCFVMARRRAQLIRVSCAFSRY